MKYRTLNIMTRNGKREVQGTELETYKGVRMFVYKPGWAIIEYSSGQALVQQWQRKTLKDAIELAKARIDKAGYPMQSLIDAAIIRGGVANAI